MNTPSVLFVIDGEEPLQRCQERALMLAGALQARLHILLWRTWSPFAAELQPRALEDGFEYLHALRDAMTCSDVQISTEVAFGAQLGEVVAANIEQTQPVLVIKVLRHGLSWRGSSADRELARTCAAPLLLTAGRAWASPARFAAAVDTVLQEGAARRRVFQSSAMLAQVCGGSLDLIDPQGTHAMSQGHYDLLAIDRPVEYRHGPGCSTPALFDSLMRTDCDLLVVPELDVEWARAAARKRVKHDTASEAASV